MIRFLLILSLFMMSAESKTIFDFSPNSKLQNWRIVDDVVMGGRSNGTIELTSEGHGLFSGEISLENNGGFSSVRYDLPDLEVQENSVIRVRLKGDSKRYQFRVRHNRERHSYITYFETIGEWQEIDFQLKELVPTYRGRRLSMPNFNRNSISEIGFLIGNNKKESFRLMIDRIELAENNTVLKTGKK